MKSEKKLLTTLALLTMGWGMQAQNSPYISRVWEYKPAPGQFVNELPAYEDGDDANDMRMKAEEQIADNTRGMITLGGWGGYVVFSFDHPVVNVPGENDFIVEGNAFYADASIGAAGGGSCEPGIVMVSRDSNGNGRPDDEWYELAGSEYTHPQTRHGYSVTYERPAPDHQATPDPVQKYRIDTTFVHWRDNAGEDGYLVQLKTHKQPYYPEWIESDELTFTGSRLPDNYEWTGSMYVLYPYDYGYADNHPDEETAAQLNIEWAVRADGTPVHLDVIHFVKVSTALHQQCGAIGETSTEVMGARDLHPDAIPSGIDDAHPEQQAMKTLQGGQLLIRRNNHIYNPLGTIINNY
jgi:hypothetical protein